MKYKNLAMSIAMHYDGENYAMSCFSDKDGCWSSPYEKTEEAYLPEAYQMIKGDLERAVEFSIYRYMDENEQLQLIIEEAQKIGGDYYELVKSIALQAREDNQ